MAEDVFGIVGTMQGGSFRVERVVAEGGFAVVYRAHHEAFRAPVALKCLKMPGTLSQKQQAEFLEKFRAEGELLFRLSATIPNVVRPLHVGALETQDGTFAPFIALEWLEGQTFDALLAARRRDQLRPLSLKKAVRLLTPVAHALDRAHHFPGPEGELAILHRDLKPENVFIARVHGEEIAKILDFGIGKVKSTATQIVGKQSARVEELAAFTPAYGAPEQWLPKRFGQTGTWTDVWGLAITLVEAVCGQSPIDGDSAAMLGQAVDEQRRPTPGNEGVEVSPQTEGVFTKALAVDPKHRYHDVGVFWRELEASLGLSSTHIVADTPRVDPRREAGSAAPRTEWMSGRGVAAPGARPGSAAAAGAEAQPTAPAAPEVPDLVLDSPAPSAPNAKRAPAPRVTVSKAGSPGGPAGPQTPLSYMGNVLDDLSEDEFGLSQSNQVLTTESRGLSGVGLSGAEPARRRPPPVAPPPLRAATAGYREHLRLPVQLVLVGIAVAAADVAYAEVAGELFRVGPVRPIWLAGGLVLVGLLMGTMRLFSGPGD